MPKKNSKKVEPSAPGTPVTRKPADTAAAEKTWSDFSSRIGDQMTQSLKERADYQKEMFAKWLQFLKLQGVGSDEKIAGAMSEYQKLYGQWNEFAEKTGEKVRESLMKSWDEQKGKSGEWMDMMNKRGLDIGGIDYKQIVGKSFEDLKNVAGQMLPKESVPKVEFPKESFENWLRQYTEAWEVVLKSPAFISFLGTMLDSTLDMRKKQDEMTADIIRSIGLPSRRDMDALYKRLHELTRKINEQSVTIRKMQKGE